MVDSNALEFAKRETVKSYVTQVGQNGHSTSVITSQRDTNVSITLRTEEGASKRQQSFELVKLPNWAGIAKVNAAIQLPKSKNDIIKIILNKAATRWNSALELPSGSERLPAVVEKDLHAVRSGPHENKKRKAILGMPCTDSLSDKSPGSGELKPFRVDEAANELPASKRFQPYKEGPEEDFNDGYPDKFIKQQYFETTQNISNPFSELYQPYKEGPEEDFDDEFNRLIRQHSPEPLRTINNPFSNSSTSYPS
jgi:hypothetical protein